MSAEEADPTADGSNSVFSAVPPGAAQVTEGLAEAVLTATPMERLRERVDDNRLAVRQLIRNLYTLEERVKELAATQRADDERLRNLEEQLIAERERVATLEDRVVALEHQNQAITDLFSDAIIDRQEAHVNAQQRDPSKIVERGAVYDLVVETILFDETPPKVLGHIDGLVIFAEIQDRRTEIAEGDVVEVQITDHRDTCAHGRLLTGGDE
jgi:TolA-binding protein